MAGREEAETLFADAERRQRELQADYALLYSKRGYRYCDLLLDRGAWGAVRDRAAQTLEWASRDGFLLDVALDKLTLGRAYLGLALAASEQSPSAVHQGDSTRITHARFSEAVNSLQAAGYMESVACGVLARAALRRATGDWLGAHAISTKWRRLPSRGR